VFILPESPASSVPQLQQDPGARSDYTSVPESYAPFAQVGLLRQALSDHPIVKAVFGSLDHLFGSLLQGQSYQMWPQQPEGLAPLVGDGLLGGKGEFGDPDPGPQVVFLSGVLLFLSV